MSSILRFKYLGYSEFQDDEKKAIAVTKDFSWSFFMNQRKGPMQFLVTKATNLLVNDTRNELLYRLPFTIANLVSVGVIWLILQRLFKNPFISFFGTMLYSANGFVVGFSRIAQYQNLNVLFSLLSLYFFIRLYQDKKNPVLISFLGTLSFCISLLSHWDAVFFVPAITYFYFLYLKEEHFSKKSIQVTVLNVILGCLILLPFLLPYIINHRTNKSNIEYFSKRIGISTYPIERHKFIFELYNPFVLIYFLPPLGMFSLIKPKRNALFIVWVIINFTLIRCFMQKPGTHIYNYVIPMIFLATAGIHTIVSITKKYAFLLFIPILIGTGFFVYQTYILFVDHSTEYPWEEKQVLGYKSINLVAPKYIDKEVLTFGFPHFRNWKEINSLLVSDPNNCTYITNEGKEISQIYMESKYGIFEEKCYYIVNIKKPFITRGSGVTFAKTLGKDSIYTYKQGGKTLTEVYKIEAK